MPDKAALKSKILDMLAGPQLAALATIADGKPWVRYMMVMARDLKLFCVTSLSSRKAAQIKANPNVHVTLGADAADMTKPYLQVAATARVLTDPKTRESMWSDMLLQHFSGPEDPDYAVIEITPTLIEYMGPGAMAPEVYIPDQAGK